MVDHTFKTELVRTNTFTNANFVILLFTISNNLIKGEFICHRWVGYTQGCPVAAVHCHMADLQRHGSNSNSPLSALKHVGKFQQIHIIEITFSIRAIIHMVGTSIGFTLEDVSTKPLKSWEMITLLMVQVEPDTIYLLGGGGVAQ